MYDWVCDEGICNFVSCKEGMKQVVIQVNQTIGHSLHVSYATKASDLRGTNRLLQQLLPNTCRVY